MDILDPWYNHVKQEMSEVYVAAMTPMIQSLVKSFEERVRRGLDDQQWDERRDFSFWECKFVLIFIIYITSHFFSSSY